MASMCILVSYAARLCRCSSVNQALRSPLSPKQTSLALPAWLPCISLPQAVLLWCAGALTRTNLVVTAVSGAGQLDLWLRSFDTANWALAVIHCGPDDFECPQCIHVEHGHGTKWQAVFQFLRSSTFKQSYGRHYKQVRLPAAWLHWQRGAASCGAIGTVLHGQ